MINADTCYALGKTNKTKYKLKAVEVLYLPFNTLVIYDSENQLKATYNMTMRIKRVVAHLKRSNIYQPYNYVQIDP